jgi:hypothetical protein
LNATSDVEYITAPDAAANATNIDKLELRFAKSSCVPRKSPIMQIPASSAPQMIFRFRIGLLNGMSCSSDSGMGIFQ